jgi:hypothetical protein
MTLVAPNTRPLFELRETFEAMPGVEQVSIEEDRVWLLCRPDSDTRVILCEAQRVVQAEARRPDNTSVEVLVRADLRSRQRVAFVGVKRSEAPDMHVRVQVTLEWEGQHFEADATGEKGNVIELRTAALAALSAIERVSDQRIEVRLGGVKQVRAFDNELMVVSLYRPGPDFQKYLGVALVGTDPLRAAALAVLHALNRVLGNYLATR